MFPGWRERKTWVLTATTVNAVENKPRLDGIKKSKIKWNKGDLASACQQCRRAAVSCFIHIALHGREEASSSVRAEHCTMICDEVQLFFFLFFLRSAVVVFRSPPPSLSRRRAKEKRDPYQSAEISDECLRKYSGCFVSFLFHLK